MMEMDARHWLTLLPADCLQERVLARDECLFSAGDRPAGVYWLQTGEVLLERHSVDGDHAPIHRAQAGSSFAEASLFADAMHCRAVAVRPSQLYLAPRESVLAELACCGDFARAFCRALAVDVRVARERIALLNFPSARDRVLAEFVARGQAGRSVTALAADVGLTPEAASRAIRQLCDEALLCRVGRGSYRLC